MENKIKIQSISDIITNSSSEVFMIFSKEGIKTFKEIISTLIGEDFDNRFNLEIYYNEYAEEEWRDSGSELSFEDWCFEQDYNSYEGVPNVEGFSISAKDPEYKDQAKMINRIYSLFDSREVYC